jgi:hypothetical protein
VNLDRQSLRRKGRCAAAALLTITLGVVAPDSASDALGPVIALTPNEINAGLAGDVGALNPSLSGRGETAGVYLSSPNFDDAGWAQLDVPGAEPSFGGRGITVSGDGCSALWVEPALVIIGLVQTPPRVMLSRRCPNFEDRPVMNLPGFYDGRAQSALSHTGRFGVIVLPTVAGTTVVPGRVIRIDTDTGAVLEMPVQGSDPAPFLGVDISDDGNIVVATRYYSYFDLGSEFPTFTTGVFVWDVSSGSVTMVGPVNDQRGSAGFPSISGNGRFVSYTSSVPLTGTESGFGPWVYVTDRTNGATRLISRANASAFNTSLSRDGSQVAYGTAASCTSGDYNRNDMSGMPGYPGFQGVTCQNPRIDVTYGPGPLTTAPLENETVSLAPNGSVAGGLHMQPALSGNGQWVSWITNNARGLGVAVAGQHAVMRRRDALLAVDSLNFGTIAAGSSSTLATTVRNTGRTSLSVDSITVAPGQFSIQGGGTCVGGSLLPPGATCTVNVRYSAPNGNTSANGTINVAEFGKDALSAANTLTGASSFTPPPTTTLPGTTTTVAGQIPPGPTTTTTTTTTVAPGSVSLTADPNPVDFGQVAVGLGSPIQTVTITNIGDASGQLLTELGGPNPDDFFVVNNGCNELVIAPGQSCTMQIMMIPLAGGHREASLILTAGGVSGDIAMFGEGHFAPILLATPAAITSDGTTTVLGRGFPPDQTFDIHIDPTNVVLTATADALGQFQIPLSALPNLTLGNYVLRVDPLPDVFDLVQGQLVVVLGTFEPQGPGGPVFGDAIIVTRGG